MKGKGGRDLNLDGMKLRNGKNSEKNLTIQKLIYWYVCSIISRTQDLII